MKFVIQLFFTIFVILKIASAQTIDAYETGEQEMVGLLDPSRFSINHSVSFGMATSKEMSIQSQSMYSTALTYKFSQPITMNLRFDLPIHSTFNDAQNLTTTNIKSADYLKNIPFEASMSWQPTDRFRMIFSVAKNNYESPLYGNSLFYNNALTSHKTGILSNRKLGQ